MGGVGESSISFPVYPPRTVVSVRAWATTVGGVVMAGAEDFRLVGGRRSLGVPDDGTVVESLVVGATVGRVVGTGLGGDVTAATAGGLVLASLNVRVTANSRT